MKKYRTTKQERDRRKAWTPAFERFGLRITPGWRHTLRRYRRLICAAERVVDGASIATLHRVLVQVNHWHDPAVRVGSVKGCRLLVEAVRRTRHPSRISMRRVYWDSLPEVPDYGIAAVIERYHSLRKQDFWDSMKQEAP